MEQLGRLRWTLKVPSRGLPSNRCKEDETPQGEAREVSRWLLCRHCRVEVASELDLVTIRGSGPQVYVNPHGIVFEILTVTEARHVLGVGRVTLEHTWFAGYTWQVVVCAQCTTHLGWSYEATRGQEPSRFYGLVRSELVSSAN